jgi:hypothetical protein
VKTEILAATETSNGLEFDFNKIKVNGPVDITKEGFNFGRTTINVDAGWAGDEVTIYTLDEYGEKREIRNVRAPDFGKATIVIANSEMVNRTIIIAVKRAVNDGDLGDNHSNAKVNVQVSTFQVMPDAPIVNRTAKKKR